MKKFLLDTRAFLWIVEDRGSLTEKVREIYLENANTIYLSVVSIWEMAIKISLNKLTINGKLSSFIEKHALGNNIQLLDITAKHVIPIVNLPFHHKDPFDRLLISQCIQERISLISRDSEFDRYELKRIWQ